MDKLFGKTAIVTGSGRGIGRAFALKLGAEGANVVINDLDRVPADETLGALASMGVQARAVNGDVTDPKFADRVVADTLSAFAGIDIIVNNAGYIWNSTIQNTSSISGLYGQATQIAYSAGKSALIGITKSLAREWGRYNVTVNCVAFGLIETRLTQRLTTGPQTIDVKGRSLKVGLDPATIDMGKSLTSLQRAGKPEEAAGAVFLLCIPESDYVTGQILECSGGYP